MSVKAGVLPAGTNKPVDSLKDGEITIKIKKFEKINGVTRLGHTHVAHCEYPDGFVKEHQTKDIKDLAPKLVGNLRARYGVESASVTEVPDFKEGALIKLEVKNGT